MSLNGDFVQMSGGCSNQVACVSVGPECNMLLRQFIALGWHDIRVAADLSVAAIQQLGGWQVIRDMALVYSDVDLGFSGSSSRPGEVSSGCTSLAGWVDRFIDCQRDLPE